MSDSQALVGLTFLIIFGDWMSIRSNCLFVYFRPKIEQANAYPKIPKLKREPSHKGGLGRMCYSWSVVVQENRVFEEIHVLALNRCVKEFIMPELSMVSALVE